MTGDLYTDRDSINPRAFAVRHLIIQEVKFRKGRAAARDAVVLDRIARGADVVYDGATRQLVVRCEGADIRRIPLNGLTLYARGDGPAPKQLPRDDVRHWDAALEENRRIVHELVDDMAAHIGKARA